MVFDFFVISSEAFFVYRKKFIPVKFRFLFVVRAFIIRQNRALLFLLLIKVLVSDVTKCFQVWLSVYMTRIVFNYFAV